MSLYLCIRQLSKHQTHGKLINLHKRNPHHDVKAIAKNKKIVLVGNGVGEALWSPQPEFVLVKCMENCFVCLSKQHKLGMTNCSGQ